MVDSHLTSPLPLLPDDIMALQALCVEYAWRIDWGEAARIPELFTDDGVWDGPWGLLRGNVELKRGWAERSKNTVQTRHLTMNMRFLPVELDVAHGWNSFLVFLRQPGTQGALTPEFLSDNVDEYARQSNGQWLLRSRKVTPCFPEAGSKASDFGL